MPSPKRRRSDRSLERHSSRRDDSRDRKRVDSRDRQNSSRHSRERESTRHSTRDRERDRERDRDRDGRSRRDSRERDRHSRDQRDSRDSKNRKDSKERDSRDQRDSRDDIHSPKEATAEPTPTEPVVQISPEELEAQRQEEEKTRLRKERIEQWKAERAAKEAASKELASKKPLEPTKDPVQPTIPLAKPKIELKKKNPKLFKTALNFAKKETLVTVSAAFESMADDDNGAVQPGAPKRKLITLDMEEPSEPTPMPIIQDDQMEVDALEMYMADVHDAVEKVNEQVSTKTGRLMEAVETTGRDTDRVRDEMDDDEFDVAKILELAQSKVQGKKKEMAETDHATVEYPPFRKDFYIEPTEVSEMTTEEVDLKRMDLDGIKVRGKECPKPIEKWAQFGMHPAVLEVIRRSLKFDRPSPIQAQGIPAITAGRDVIGIAKTGSGKTLAFLIPMFRHIKDQPPLKNFEGPIALIMTPTRELAVQINKDCKAFLKVLNLRSVCCYGGSPIKDQIADLKRGTEIVICTPGRMIELLTANAGRVTNLKRVTYLVLDEADRMFDMGFEPQVMKIIRNIRPDRQTVLFSATFPRKMEALARKTLKKPLEITVGGRSVVAPEVTQVVQVHRDEDSKYIKLLSILGDLATSDPDAKVLIFVDRQEAADGMLIKLLRRGYGCLSLHGGKDQSDRESTIADFKSGMSNILVATSIAARGLDVKDLKVVVNYECPNHLEDYVHRAGRTGRAGNKGTCYTFITPEQDRFALDIIKALNMSGVPVPRQLQALADGFMEKIKKGSARVTMSGFGGRGLFMIEAKKEDELKQQKEAHGEGSDKDEGEASDKEEEKLDIKTAQMVDKAQKMAQRYASFQASAGGNSLQLYSGSGSGSSNAVVSTGVVSTLNHGNLPSTVGHGLRGKGRSSDSPFSFEFEINDFPAQARYKITRREQVQLIAEGTGCAITIRGVYVPPGRQPPPGDRKLYLVIDGESEIAVRNAKVEVQRMMMAETVSSLEAGDSFGGQSGRYQIGY